MASPRKRRERKAARLNQSGAEANTQEAKKEVKATESILDEVVETAEEVLAEEVTNEAPLRAAAAETARSNNKNKNSRKRKNNFENKED